MSDSLVFYTNPHSRGRIVRWMLEEVGAPYETVVLEYGPQMKSPEYLKLNPMGKVPTVVHNGNVVTECAAICMYLADAFPEVNLVPEPAHRASYFRWFFYGAGPAEYGITLQSLGFEVPKEKEGRVGHGNYNMVVETLAKAVKDRHYIAGSAFSAVDVYLGSQIGFGLQFKTLPDLPEFTAYWQRLTERKAFQRGSELDNALISNP